MYILPLVMSIILISTMIVSTFFSKPGSEKPENIVDVNLNLVGAGNFSYWRLSFDGRIAIEVQSITGDADAYVSESLLPSYESDRNNFSSATCGVDIVMVPSDFPRPLTLAVFGHWSHSISEYKVSVDQLDYNDGHLLSPRHPFVLHNVKPDYAEMIVHHILEENPEKSGKKKDEESEASPPGLVRSWILSIIGVVVELFVL